MKGAVMRLGAVFLLVMLFIIGMLPGQTGEGEDAGITVSAPCEENGEIYIHIRSANAQRQADGRYLVEVEFTTDTAQRLMGMRMVTVFCGEQRSVFSLTEDNMEELHTVCFSEAMQPEEVRVEVRAHQTEAGLLLMSEGEGQLCGEAAAPVNGDRVLLLSGAPAGSSYELYRVAELHELLSGMVVLNLVPTEEELETYAVRERYMTTLTMDENGAACCNFTMEGFEDGVYLLTGEQEAYYVCLPSVEASGAFRSSAVRVCVGRET